MKKIISLALALIMILSLATTAFAAGTGSITITNATENVEYSIYKVFDLTYSETDPTKVSYTYTKTDDADALYAALTGDGSPFTLTASVDANVYNVSTTADSATIAAWLKENVGILTETDSETATAGTVTFENVDFGYYYVTSTLGTVVTVNSTMPDVTFKDKNIAPTIEKKVQEDSKTGDEAWGDSNDAEFGETVYFKIVINAYAGAQNYILTDTLPNGLSLNTDSIEIDGLVENTEYTLVTTASSFTITFDQDYLNTITGTTDSADKITVTYSALLNNNATVAADGNKNKAMLKYGAGSAYTTDATTTTYTWGLNVLKYGDNNQDKRLPGVEFVLLNSDATKVATVVGNKLTGWTDVPTDGTSWPANTKLITDANGIIVVNGLDDGKYYLRETKALPGYNKLAADEDFTINDAIAEVAINNLSGSVLPDTGGMGTTLFYILGGLLTVGALVLLVTKKRMNAA